MSNIKINKNILFTIDLTGVAIINKENDHHLFITYPEAAVFSVIIENSDINKSNLMLQAILDKNEPETSRFINQCLKKWKDINIFHQDDKFINNE